MKKHNSLWLRRSLVMLVALAMIITCVPAPVYAYTTQGADGDYTIVPSQAGFIWLAQPNTVQTVSNDLLVKNNGDVSGSNTRRAYLKFNLDELKANLDDNLQVSEVKLICDAKINKAGTAAKTLYVRRVKERGWTSDDLCFGTRPIYDTTYGRENVLTTSTVSGTTYETKEMDVTDYVVSRMNSNSPTVSFCFTVSECAGEMVNIRYSNDSKPVLVVALEKKIESVRISDENAPKTYYRWGEMIDVETGALTVAYKDGSIEEVPFTNSDVELSSSQVPATNSMDISVSYKGFTCQYPITVDVPTLSVDYMNTPMCGDELTGGLTVMYADGTSVDLQIPNEGVQVDKYVSGYGWYDVQVIYDGASIELVKSYVHENESVHIRKLPDIVDYTQGEELNLAGGEVEIKCDNCGASQVLPLSSFSFSVVGYDKYAVGEQTLDIYYARQKIGSFTVNVVKGDMHAGQVIMLDHIQYNTPIVGQDFEITSAKATKYTGVGDNTTTSDITDLSNIQVTGYDKTKGGYQTVTVTYGGHSETIYIYVYTKKTETLKIGVSEANHSKKSGSLAALTSHGYVKNYGNNTVQTYIKMDLSALQAIKDSGAEDFEIKSAKLKLEAKGYGTGTSSRRLQLYKVGYMSDSALDNGGKTLSWANNRLKAAIGSYWCVNQGETRAANWDVTSYVEEAYDAYANVLFGFGLTQSDNNKEVRILNVYNEAKTYLEVQVEYLQ